MTHHKHYKNARHTATDTSSCNAGPSPAQKYQAFRERRRQEGTSAAQFAQSLPFGLDKFQRRALDDLESGNNLLVAAPTGAGKTVIADFAIHLAQQDNVKAFYTTPIKALSNQKYHELANRYGPDKVGLLTGDISINSQADIIVMTTEVLRNMLYEDSATLTALRYVILDEIHYLADRMRGQVWEEVIIHLPRTVKIVGLSATVSNVEDFARWIESVRGETSLVVSEKRPVPLIQEVLLQHDQKKEPRLVSLYLNGDTSAVNPELTALIKQWDHEAVRSSAGAGGKPYRRGRGGGAGTSWQGSLKDTRNRPAARYTPKRWAVVDELDFLDMLPGIYFIFSRNGCDKAVEQCMRAGLQLTGGSEARRIRRIVDSMAEGRISRDDARALGFANFRNALEQGIAPHHAGMVALYREIVEKLFEQGLLKIVFATETLALGINMPARCVVVEKLEKFNGVSHETLSPGEFTQLTGRAGRRGIDSVGYAIVVDHRDFEPSTAAALSSKRVYPLHSSFRPTFNMAVNLLNLYDADTVRSTLDHSFAQWEAAKAAEKLISQIRAGRESIQGYEKAFACEYGDFASFMRLRMELTNAERSERRRLKHTSFKNKKAKDRAWRDLDSKIIRLREEEHSHPCRQCPDIKNHLRIGYKWAKLSRELDRLEDRYNSRTGTVSRQFDRICSVLAGLGYIEKSHGGEYAVCCRGQLLRRIYSENDITIAQVLISGVLDGLSPEEMAAVASGFVYESRTRGGSGFPRHFPGGSGGRIAKAAAGIAEIDEEIRWQCEDAGLDDAGELDFGLCEAIFDWTSGKSLAEILAGTELTGGDFVRSCKRTVDILIQLSKVGEYLDNPYTATVAQKAADLVNKGIVAYSGVDGD